MPHLLEQFRVPRNLPLGGERSSLPRNELAGGRSASPSPLLPTRHLKVKRYSLLLERFLLIPQELIG